MAYFELPSIDEWDKPTKSEIEEAAARIYSDFVTWDQFAMPAVAHSEWNLYDPEGIHGWLGDRFPGGRLTTSAKEVESRQVFRFVLDYPHGPAHEAIGPCCEMLALIVFRSLRRQDRHGLRSSVQSALSGPLASEWTAYRHRVPGSRRALALALHRTIPGTMRAFPGVGE